MTVLGPREIETADFKASFLSDGDVVRATLFGNADMDAHEALDRVVSEMHAAAETLGAREVVADIRNLQFMSSSCLKVLVVWIERIRSISPEKRYVLRFISDPSRPWQRRSLNALSCFAVDLVKIDV